MVVVEIQNGWFPVILCSGDKEDMFVLRLELGVVDAF